MRRPPSPASFLRQLLLRAVSGDMRVVLLAAHVLCLTAMVPCGDQVPSWRLYRYCCRYSEAQIMDGFSEGWQKGLRRAQGLE